MKGGGLVTEARRRAGISQAELARRSGTTQSAIARIETGRAAPSLERLSELVRACGFDLQVRIVPYDTHEWTLAQRNLTLTPAERLEKILATARVVGAATFERPDAG